MPVDVKYTTSATATATGGRDGNVRTDDGKIAVALSTPKELGGPGGEGTNPEKLFASGYSAYFLGALKMAGRELKLLVSPETMVTAQIGIGPRLEGGFGIAAALSLHLPGFEHDDVQRLIDTAHGICPYSNATRNNVDVQLSCV